MIRRLRYLLNRRRGATTTETVILLLLVIAAVTAAVRVLQTTLGGKVEDANVSVGAVSTEHVDEDQQRIRRNAARAKRRQAGSEGDDDRSQRSSKADRALVDASSGQSRDGTPVERRPAADRQATGGLGGFNPFIIPIALGLLGMLVYVIIKSQKD